MTIIKCQEEQGVINICFSDKENGIKERITEEISIDIWNGIVSVFEEFKVENCFAKKFPEYCYDDNNKIYGTNVSLLESRIKAEIPKIEIPIETKTKRNEITDKIDLYSTLDFIEFCYKNLSEVKNNDYHEYFKHYHLKFIDSKNLKDEFVNKINEIFKRNRVLFYLDDNGKIKRSINKTMEKIINKSHNDILDKELKEYIEKANNYFISPKTEDKYLALKELWSAFERIKTEIDKNNKKKSIEKLIEIVSDGDKEFQKNINNECNFLTKIGNSHSIRHSETSQKKFNNSKDIDYYFYRMSSLIDLLLKGLPKNFK